MLQVMKKSGRIVTACCLGEEDPLQEALVRSGRVKPHGDRWEAFSQEAVASGSGQGQLAHKGDYIKVDGSGWPYPNRADWFRKHHRHIQNQQYEELPSPLEAYTAEEPISPEVDYLIREKGLIISPDTPEHYFSAPLWGTWETAPRDAVLVFYSITRDKKNVVVDAEFNFVQRDEFDRTYTILSADAGC